MSGAVPVSAVILCHNEADNLPRCLAALQACGEVVVLDDGSEDGGPEIARELGARVVVNPFSSFADQRNWAMDHAALKYPWVLHLDADEVATPELLDEISKVIARSSASAVGFIARKVMLGEHWLRYSAGYPVYVPRLIHRQGPRYFMRGHGEWIDAPAERAFRLDAPMLHYNFSRGWDDWWERHHRYADAEARRILAGLPAIGLKALFDRDPTVRRSAMRSWSYRLPGRPWWRFVYSYILKRGFMDGRPGLEFCRAMQQYERMIDQRLRDLRGGR